MSKKDKINKKYMDPNSEPVITEALARIPNKFLLSLVVAKRGRQLKDGIKPTIPIEEGNEEYIKTAMKEIITGRITVNEVEAETFSENELIREMDQLLDKEIEEAKVEEEKKTKDKGKSKSKSLAA